MSNEVDKRIIEMEFKNDQFEKNAAKTLQTLQELKQKLNDNFSTKGAEELNRAIKSVDVSPISQGLETVQLKFNALQIAGKRVIENIVDAAMNAVHQVTSKLTGVINQIKVGGANRAQNIESAKFMLSGLGIEWKDIVDDINYGVQDTAYGLDAAAKVASQLVASNVTLGKDMQASLRAVSGVAAMTNSTYEEIGHIFTSVAGQGKLMTMQLQQFSLRGLNVAADLAKYMNTTEAEIRDMVTKGKIDFMTFAKAMDELYGEHAKEANKTFSGALSNTKAALSRLGADIQSQKFESFRIILLEVTTQLKDFKKAIKPAEDAIIEMMAAVGNLVANFVKTANLKAIAEKIVPPIKKAAEYVRDFADAWRMIREEAVQPTNVAEFITKLKTGTVEAKDATDDAITSLEKLSKLKDDELKKHRDQAFDIWNFGTYGNGQDRIDALGEDYELTQAYVDKMIELGWDEAKMEEYLNEQREKAEKEEARRQAVNKLKITVSKVLTIFTNLKTVLHNVTSSVVNILKATFSGLSDAISGKGSGFLDALIFLTGKLADFTSKIAITKERAEKIRPIAKAIGDVIIFIGKALYNATKHLINFIEKASKNETVRKIFTAIGDTIKKVVDGLKKLSERVKESGAWDKFVDILKTVGTWLGERLVDAIGLLGNVIGGIAEGAVTVFEKLVGKVSDFGEKTKEGHSWLSKIGDWFKEDILSGSWLTKLKDLLTDIFGAGKDVFQNAYQKMGDFMRGLIQAFKDIDMTDVQTALYAIKQIAYTLLTAKLIWDIASASKNISKSFKALSGMFDGIKSTIKKYGRKADSDTFVNFAKGVAILVGSYLSILITFAYLKSKNIDYNSIARQAFIMVSIFTLMIGLLSIFKAKVTKADLVTGGTVKVLGSLKIPAVAATLFAIAYLFKTLIDGITNIYLLRTDMNYDQDEMREVMLNTLLLLSGLITFTLAVIKMSKDVTGMTGMAFMLVGMTILFSSLIKGFKKVLEIVEGVKTSAVDRALKVVEWLTIPVYIFGVLISLVSKIPTNTVSNTNPFKGMIGMFIGLAVMIRLGFVPLLETLSELRNSGKVGRQAIDDFKSIVNTLYIFVGLLTLVIALLDRSIFKDGKVTGAEFLDGKYIGDVKTGGKRSISNNKLVYGVMGIVLSIAAMFYTLSLVMKNMKGVDSHSIARLKEMVQSILIIVGLISVVMSVIGAIDQTKGVPLALAAVAGLFLGIAAILAATAYSVKTFADTIKDIVDWLPEGLKKIEEFFDMIASDEGGGHHRGSHRDKLIKGVKDTASLLKESFWAALVAWSEPSKNNIGDIVHNLFTTLIIALNALADEFTEQGPDLVNAADRCALGFLYFLSLVFQKLQERGKDLFHNLGIALGGAIVNSMNPIIKHYLGLDDLEVEADSLLTDKYWEKERERIAKEEADAAAKAAGSIYEQNAAKWAKESEERSKAISTGFVPNEDFIEEEWNKVMNSNTVKSVKKQLFDQILSGNLTGSQIESIIKSGDFSGLGLNINTDKLLEESGISDLSNFDINQFLGFGDNIDLDSTGWLDQLNDQFSEYGYTFEYGGEENGDAYTEALRDSMMEVTTISSEAAEAGVKTLKDYQSDYFDAGKFCTQGFADGLLEEYAMARVKLNAYDVVDKAKTAMENRAQEKSPSKVFHKIGEFITLGFANGIVDSVSAASGAADEVGKATILSMRDTIKQASMTAMDGINNPRITPILDLSNVAEGVGMMNGLFDTSPAYQLAMATSGEARTATRNRIAAIYQNGSSYDDTNAIGAINSLNSEVATLKDAIEGMQVVLDGRALVGQIATPMDKALGKRALAGRRKV